MLTPGECGNVWTTSQTSGPALKPPPSALQTACQTTSTPSTPASRAPPPSPLWNTHTPRPLLPPPPPPVVTSAQVHKALRSVRPRKAAGPDNIPGRALRACANELADVLTSIFNLSLSQCIVPRCYKTTTVVPVPKKNPPSCLNDFRPVALTPIIMKCFGTTGPPPTPSLPPSMSPFPTWKIKTPTSGCSLSTTAPPSTLQLRLQHLSPILYTLFTHDCVASHPDNTIVKFADDTAVIGRITCGDEADYRREVDSLITWCGNNNLTLNTDKTKEMIVDMRKERRPHQPLFIRGLEVERVNNFKYLGVHISDDLTWTFNTTQVVKKAQQRLYFLRRLRKFGMAPKILSNFYSCIIESVLTTCITVWYGSSTVWDHKRLQRVVKTASKITRTPQPSLQSIYHRRVHRRAASIINDPRSPPARTLHTPALRPEVQECEMQQLLLPHGRQTVEQLNPLKDRGPPPHGHPHWTFHHHILALYPIFLIHLKSSA